MNKTTAEKRRVIVYKMERVQGESRHLRVYDTEGIFCGYGSDIIEYDGGFASFTVAIVEIDDGSVRLVQVDLIEFKDIL